MKRLSLLAVAAMIGCAIESNPPPRPTDAEVVRALITPSLAVGAVELAAAIHAQGTQPPPPITVDATPIANGTLFRLDVEDGTDPYFVFRAGKFIRVKGTPPPPPRGTSLLAAQTIAVDDGALVLRCFAGGQADGSIIRGAELTPLEDAATWCANASQLGPSSIAGRFTLMRYPTSLRVEIGAYRLDGNRIVAAGAPSTFDLPGDYRGPGWFGEVADGIIATAWIEADKWSWQRPDRMPIEIPPAFGSKGVTTVRKTSAALELAGHDPTSGEEKWVAWNVDGDGSVAAAGVIEPLTGTPGPSFGERIETTLEPDPRDDKVLMPTAVRVRREEPGGLHVSPVPVSPCASASSCWSIGESRLIATAGEKGAAWGIYWFWSWRDPAFYYAAPLDGRPIP